MESTLTPRKIVFSLLIGLLLAFSVQSQPGHTVNIRVPQGVSGYPGGTETLTLFAPENAFIRVGSPEDTFPLENSSNPIRSGTIYRSTLRLPRQTGTYTLSVWIETTRYPVTVRVTTTPAQTGVLRVRVEPFKDAPGTTATVKVSATDLNNQPANVTVILTATGGTLSTSSVTTGTDGNPKTVTLTRGSTVGNENYIIATAPNYDLVSSRFLISQTPQRTSTPPMTGTPISTPIVPYDVNKDGTVDNTDARLVVDALRTNNPRYDVNTDGVVDFIDVRLVFDNRDNKTTAAPIAVGNLKLTAIQIGIIKEQIDLLNATNDRSPAALKTLIYLQQLIATARPEKTQLLANYPNPFNPETWIPYELATDTDVRITIYNAQGVVIRTLQLDQQSAGYYTDRERAAYWDGRNALGEQVASGIYFYQFETDEMSSMRKMVILK